MARIRYFSEGKARSIALLREAICTLEAEVSDARAAHQGAPYAGDSSKWAGTPPAH
jgi:hypothetical protein